MIKHILKNFSSLITGQLIYKIITFFTLMIIARFLGPDGFGKFSYGLSFVWFFLFIADFGFCELFIRDVASDKKLLSKYVNNIITLKLLISFIVYAIVVFLAFIFAFKTDKFWIILLLGASVILDSFMYFFRSLFRVKETMGYEGVLLVIEAVLKLLVIFISSVLGLNFSRVILISFAFLFISLANLIINWWVFSLQYKEFVFSVEKKFSLYLLKSAFPFALIYLLSLFNFRVNVIMLASLKNDTIAGWYSADYKLLEQLLIFPMTISFVCLPVFSRLASSLGKINKVIRQAILFLFLTGMLIVTLFYFFGTDLIRITFGEGYKTSGNYLFLISLALPLFFIKPVLEKLLYVLRKQNLLFIIYGLGILVNIALNLLVIPRWGIAGVSIVTLFSEGLVVFVSLLMYIRYQMPSYPQQKSLELSRALINSEISC